MAIPRVAFCKIMKIILTENIKGLGQIGEIREVKNGYARNFLVPKKLVVLATAENLKRIDELKEKRTLALEGELKRMKEVGGRLAGFRLLVESAGDEKGNLYAAVNSKKLSSHLKEKGIEVKPEFILTNEPIKKTGLHPVLFKYYDIEAPFEVEVVLERRAKLR